MSFNSNKHLVWGDEAIDDPPCPQAIQVHLKRSKTDQLGKRIDVFIGTTNSLLSSVELYSSTRSGSRAVFKFANGNPLTKATQHIQAA